MDEREQAMVSSFAFSGDVPEEIQEIILEWHLDKYYLNPQLLPSMTVRHLLEVNGRHFVTFSHEGTFSEYPHTEVVMVRNSFLDFCFTFSGNVDGCHLSRTRKSLIIKTDEPCVLNGEPWVISRCEKYILTLDGDVRNQG